MKLIDSHQRHIHKLRVSLLDACNMKCTYCMPEDIRFYKNHELLRPRELAEIVKNLVRFGIDEIRVTGGEPLLRTDFLEIIERFSELDIKRLAITTNATKLIPLLPKLKKTKCQYINISLDSLNQKNFNSITKLDAFEDVLTAIFMAKELGFQIKINTVVMRGINDHEILDFCEFSVKNSIPVRFLELMKIGVMKNSSHYLVSAKEMKDKIEKKYELSPLATEKDSTSITYRINNQSQIGFIASETQAFCGQCSRLRLDSKGNIYPCLFKNEGPNLKDVPLNLYPQLLNKLIDQKPTHRIESVDWSMNMIGG